MEEMKTFRNTPALLANERLFSKYPQVISDLFERLMSVDERAKEGLYTTLHRGIKENFWNLETLKDWLQFRKV
jgi:hypothetical protein